MPLVGFSAQIIPYVMAIIFTVMFFNGNAFGKNKDAEKSGFEPKGQIFLQENRGATAVSIHFDDFSKDLTAVEVSKCNSLNPQTGTVRFFYRFDCYSAVLLRFCEYRGPPLP